MAPTPYPTQLAAMAALANKREPQTWQIEQTENGWWVVVRKTNWTLLSRPER